MSRNYYSEIHLHIVWHTKNSVPLLNAALEPMAHRFLRRRIVETPGAFVHEIGGIEDHVHVVVTIPPTLLISDWIGKLKGGSAHDVNQEAGKLQKVLQWQTGYGVVSFGTGDLEWVKAYARNQREHHRHARIHERLETITHSEQDRK
jgi:putative transposase